MAVACFLNLDLEPSHLVDFQVARSVLKVELWLPLVLASVLHHPLVPQGLVHHSPLARLLLVGPCLAVRLHLVPLLHLEELQLLEAHLKEAWLLVHPAGSLEVHHLADLDNLKVALHSVPWRPSRTFHRLVLWLGCLGHKGLVVFNNKHPLPLARSAVAAAGRRVPVALLLHSGGDETVLDIIHGLNLHV